MDNSSSRSRNPNFLPAGARSQFSAVEWLKDAHAEVEIRAESPSGPRRGAEPGADAHFGARSQPEAAEEVPRSDSPGAEAGRAAAQQEGEGRRLRARAATDGNHGRPGHPGA